MKNFLALILNLNRMLTALVLLPLGITAQRPTEGESSEGTLWYVILPVVGLALAGAVIVLVRGWRARSNDAKRKQRDNQFVDKAPQFRRRRPAAEPRVRSEAEESFEQMMSQIKPPELKQPAVPEKAKFSALPVSSFTELAATPVFEPLRDSADEELLNAVYQTQEDVEDDEEVRESALKIMAAFKNRNTVEALAQIAQYDISADLRSKAALTLAEFDHESVFEPILLACADPSRSVRAAAARGLFMLSFDRAEAFMRIAESNDDFRMRQAAHAAIEADFVGRSFDRLIHPDRKMAYEAFALLVLLVRAGETGQIFDALRNHKDENVKMALLQVLKTVKQDATLSQLHYLAEQNFFSGELAKMLEEVIESLEPVHA